MFPVMRRAHGFGLIEVMVVLAIMAILMAVGIPMMSDWVQANKAASANEFYAEGVRTARAEAVRHNAVSRLVLSENSASGQMDWTVDLCFPKSPVRCTDKSGAWSTPSSPSATDPEGKAGFHSVVRSASSMLPAAKLQYAVQPTGATSAYFTSIGWVDTTIPARLARIELTPVSSAQAFPPSAIVITLAGNAVKCNPAVASGDSRACQ